MARLRDKGRPPACLWAWRHVRQKGRSAPRPAPPSRRAFSKKILPAWRLGDTPRGHTLVGGPFRAHSAGRGGAGPVPDTCANSARAKGNEFQIRCGGPAPPGKCLPARGVAWRCVAVRGAAALAKVHFPKRSAKGGACRACAPAAAQADCRSPTQRHGMATAPMAGKGTQSAAAEGLARLAGLRRSPEINGPPPRPPPCPPAGLAMPILDETLPPPCAAFIRPIAAADTSCRKRGGNQSLFSSESVAGVVAAPSRSTLAR